VCCCRQLGDSCRLQRRHLKSGGGVEPDWDPYRERGPEISPRYQGFAPSVQPISPAKPLYSLGFHRLSHPLRMGSAELARGIPVYSQGDSTGTTWLRSRCGRIGQFMTIPGPVR
jgi:hypothetical protein